MGSASKILTLLSTPFPLICPRGSPSTRFLRITRHALSHTHHRISHSTPRSILPTFHLRSFSSSALSDSASGPLLNNSALVTQILRLLEGFNAKGYFRNSGSLLDDEFVTDEGLGDDFFRAAEVCFAIARDRPDALRFLSRKDLEVIVNNGSPSLFKNSTGSENRMKLFLSGDETKVLESERAQTVDIMRYVLSYAHDSLNISEGINTNDAEPVETSVKNVITQIINMSGTDAIPRQTPVNYEQTSRAPMQNIEMKRGDWICAKCSFMNFARNSRCLECDEARPKTQLTGGEWECPQCDYYNYGRNMSCLRCDCRRPGEIPSATPYPKTSTLDQILSGKTTDKSDLEQKLAANDEKAERWFNKISQLGDKADINNSIPDEDFPEIMPLRKGVNRFVVSTRKTPLERRLANSQSEISKPSESSINKSLDRILGRTTSASQSESGDYRQSIAKSDPNYVPFVPLPPDMFKKPQNSVDVPSELNSVESKNNNESFENSATTPDDDFPEIMPMRKGENRFVVSKKKDRSLTSPQYKRRIAMEQASKSDFIPFVPFPPDYFAKKDKQPEASTANTGTSEASENTQTISEKLDNKSNVSWNGGNSSMSNASNNSLNTDWDSTQDVEKHQNMPQNTQTSSSESSDSGNYNKSYTHNYSSTYGSTQYQRPSHNIQANSNKSWNNETITSCALNNTSSTYGSTEDEGKYQKTSQNISQNSISYSGKSLEGSAVTEPDPLDMSEEAKAARWFRRAAQIKNISELSEIPDEDFPEIMPMRKGVNRFVVSKRKTPLERRLTSPQYRRNLPIVSSEPEKDSSESSSL